MEKMIKKINISKIIIIFVILQPLIDLVTSVLIHQVSEVLTLGIVIRALFMVGIVVYSFLISDKSVKKKLFIYYAILAVYALAYIVIMYKNYSLQMIITQIKGVVKALYLPVVLVSFIVLLKNKLIKCENNIFIYTLLGYVGVIFLARIFNIGYPTYEIGYNVGTIGLFYAANEVGCIITLLAPFLFMDLIKCEFKFNKTNVINLITLFLYIFAVLEMGTKVPFLGFIGLVILTLIICVGKIFRSSRELYTKKVIVLIVTLIVTVILIPSTSVGKNIEMNYDIALPNIMKVFSNGKVSEPVNKKENTSMEVTNVVSSRNLFLHDNLKKYKESRIANKLFGIGYVTSNEGKVDTLKLVEMDYIDLFFIHGIIGVILILLPIIYLGIQILILLIKKFKKAIVDTEILLTAYSLLIGLGIALIAGHVLVAPAVAIFIILDIIILKDKLEVID